MKRIGTPKGVTWQVRSLLLCGDASAAARASLAAYGAELFGFLIGTLDDPDVARIVYAEICRRAEAEISGFSWACTLRAWLYALARSELRERRRLRPHCGESVAASAVVVALPQLAVAMNGAAASLRKALPEEDREILILSVDRGLDWAELAHTSLGDRAGDEALRVEARTLRARVSEIRDQLAAALRRAHRRPR